MANHGLLVDSATFAALREKPASSVVGRTTGYPTMIQALDAAPDDADTLLIDYFPNLLEHTELLTRLGKIPLKRLVFRRPSRTHGFFLSSNAHARLDTLENLGIKVYWFNPELGDLYLHTYKKGHGFFIREELAKRFAESTILAFYGSAVGLDAAQTSRISALLEKLAGFMGPNVGVLTGGGGGVMRLATDQARDQGALTGACYLELEAQPPELGVDFFNTFQENSRHFRQKWFEVADFCVFNVGGVGTLEEIGIEMCNLKLGIRPRVPYVFLDRAYFSALREQLQRMVAEKRAPAWMLDYVLFTDDADEAIQFYRKKLQVL
jgi:predicted Rossmann-fold nucleotide-binding protein